MMPEVNIFKKSRTWYKHWSWQLWLRQHYTFDVYTDKNEKWKKEGHTCIQVFIPVLWLVYLKIWVTLMTNIWIVKTTKFSPDDQQLATRLTIGKCQEKHITSCMLYIMFPSTMFSVDTIFHIWSSVLFVTCNSIFTAVQISTIDSKDTH